MSVLPAGYPSGESLGPRSWRLEGGRVLREVGAADPGSLRARAQAFGAEVVVGEEGRLFVLRPFVEGLPLRAPVDPATAVEIAELVARAEQPLYDLRPEHLVRTPGGALVLCDPGWSPAGRPPYASPEQHGRGAVGPAAGLYQLGATLTELLAGEAPPDALTLCIPGAEPPAIPGLPSSLSELVRRLLDPDPADRPPAQAVAEAFRSWLAFRQESQVVLAPEPPAPAPCPPARSRLGPRWPLAAVGAVLVLVAAAFQGSPGEPASPSAESPAPPPVRAADRPSGSPLPKWWVHPKDGSRMVLVPGGPFRQGPYAEEGPGAESRRSELPAFYLDRFEVTNEQFRRFVRESGYTPQGRWERYATRGRERHPVIAVSWYDAEAYARWAGKRLPKEQEWEKAARGGDGRTYPWGRPWDPTRLNCFECSVGNTTPVGTYPAGASPYGIEDLAGNAWEWVDAWYIPLGSRSEGLPLLRVARGGSRSDPAADCTTVSRRGVFPENGNLVNSGFRCALDPAP